MESAEKPIQVLSVIISRRPNRIQLEIATEVFQKLKEQGGWRVFLGDEATDIVSIAKDIGIETIPFLHIEAPKPIACYEDVVAACQQRSSNGHTSLRFDNLISIMLSDQSPLNNNGLIKNKTRQFDYAAIAMMQWFLIGNADALLVFPSSGTRAFLEYMKLVTLKYGCGHYPRTALVNLKVDETGLERNDQRGSWYEYFTVNSDANSITDRRNEIAHYLSTGKLLVVVEPPVSPATQFINHGPKHPKWDGRERRREERRGKNTRSTEDLATQLGFDKDQVKAKLKVINDERNQLANSQAAFAEARAAVKLKKSQGVATDPAAETTPVTTEAKPDNGNGNGSQPVVTPPVESKSPKNQRTPKLTKAERGKIKLQSLKELGALCHRGEPTSE